MPPDLESDYDGACDYILSWFYELFRGERLTYTEVMNWSRLTKRNLSAFDVDLLFTAERSWWKVKNDN